MILFHLRAKRNLEDELERVSYDNEILFGIFDTVKLKFSFNKIFLYPFVKYLRFYYKMSFFLLRIFCYDTAHPTGTHCSNLFKKTFVESPTYKFSDFVL
jgi:hypothetical protein